MTTAAPDAKHHNPGSTYLRELVDQTGLSQHAAARRIGISPRMLRYYLAPESADHRDAPYPVQFALEQLAATATKAAAPTGARVPAR